MSAVTKSICSSLVREMESQLNGVYIVLERQTTWVNGSMDCDVLDNANLGRLIQAVKSFDTEHKSAHSLYSCCCC